MRMYDFVCVRMYESVCVSVCVRMYESVCAYESVCVYECVCACPGVKAVTTTLKTKAAAVPGRGEAMKESH